MDRSTTTMQIFMFALSVLLVPINGNRDDFVKWGLNHGDKVMPKADDASVFETLTDGANKGKKIYINTNGVLSFDNQYNFYRARSTTNPFTDKDGLIFAYWADLSNLQAGNIYYRHVTDSQSLAEFNTEIRAFDVTFSAAEAIVATWVDVPLSNALDSQIPNNRMLTNTFQAVLVFGNTGKAYVALFYETLQSYPATYATSSANAGHSMAQNNFCQLFGSHSADVLKLTCRSNTGTPGYWRFGLTKDAQIRMPCPTGYTSSTKSGTCFGDSGTVVTQGPTNATPVNPPTVDPVTQAPTVSQAPPVTQVTPPPQPTVEPVTNHDKCRGNNRMYKNDKNCLSYYQCHNGAYSQFTCPSTGNKYFDEKTQQCVSSIPESCYHTSCVSFAKTFETVIGPSQCSNFVACTDRSRVQGVCSSGHSFDASDNACVPHVKVGCADPDCVNKQPGLYTSHSSSCDAKYVYRCEQKNGVMVKGNVPSACMAIKGLNAIQSRANQIPNNVDFKPKYFDKSSRSCQDTPPNGCVGCDASPCLNGASCAPIQSAPFFKCTCTGDSKKYGYTEDTGTYVGSTCSYMQTEARPPNYPSANFVSECINKQSTNNFWSKKCGNTGGFCDELTPAVGTATKACNCTVAGGWYGLRCESLDGKWAQWESWSSSCSKNCGGGFISRKRECSNPAPVNAGLDCVGEKTQQQPCNNQPCPIDGQWTEFGYYPSGIWRSGTFTVGYGPCSKACGQGLQRRSRECTNPTPQFGGKSCVGDNYEEKACQLKPCEAWGQWSIWGVCQLTCYNTGTKNRTRDCMLGNQKVDVSFCPPGKTLEIQDCNNTDNCKTTRNADIAFVFDESESMRDSANFEVQTQFASDISKIFTKDPDAIVDFAFIDFSTTAAIELTFAQFSDFKKNDPKYNMPNWLQNVNKQRPACKFYLYFIKYKYISSIWIKI